jgi:hypothetical protein
MKKLLLLIIIVNTSMACFSQTWLEKANNGLDFGTNNPPSAVNVNIYSEPFDTSWRNGFTGIGTALWPKTRLQVHSNANVDTDLDNLMQGLGSSYSDFTSIFSSGGTNSQGSFAGSVFAFTSRSNVQNAINFGTVSVAMGSNIENNIGFSSNSLGNNNTEMSGVVGVAIGNNITNLVRGVFGEAGGDGTGVGNFGIWGQCSTTPTDVNSVNVGVFGRGVLGSKDEPALVNIGVHGRAECSSNGGGGTQFNCGVFGQNLSCSDSTNTTGNYPTGSFAGYFDGNVLVTGNLWQLSDAKLKENVTPLSKVTEKLGKVNIYSYNFRQEAGVTLPSGKEYGVIAQELEKEFPELVKEVKIINHNDIRSYRNIETVKSVEYISFIPLLIQSIKELNDKIDALDPDKVLHKSRELKEKIAEIEANMNQAAINSKVDLSNYLTAYPNPSKNSMTIHIKNVSCSNCVLMVTDLSGKMIKQFTIDGSGTMVRLSNSDFGSGIYQCNLILDGKVLSGIRIAFTN